MGAASRERFRVVAENEFFQGTDLDWLGTSARPPREGRWARRVAGAAIVATVSALGGAVVVSMSPAARQSRGRDAVRGATHSGLPANPVVAQRLPASIERRAPALRAARREHGRVGVKGRPERRLGRLRSARAQVADTARRKNRAATDGVQPLAASRHVVRPAFGATYIAPRPSTRRAEFGFEH